MALLTVLAVSSCGGKDNPTQPTPTTTRIIELSGNLAFGSVTVGQSADATLTIRNSGNAPLSITGMTAPSATAFTTSFTSGTIAAGASQSVTIRFTPGAAQAYGGTLTVNGDQTGGTNTIQISGTGISAAPAKANIQVASSTINFVCVTGLCSSATFPVTNLGPGCAINTQVVARAFGADGNGAQLGVDIPMGLPGTSLSAYLFRPGATVTLQSISTFNDVRSAHTVFRTTITWTDVACQ